MRRALMAGAAAVVGAMGMTLGAGAQPPAGDGAGAGGAGGANLEQPSPLVPVPPFTPEVKAVVDRALKAYSTASSYEDTAVLEMELSAKNAAGEDQGEKNTQKIAFAFEKPGKVRAAFDHGYVLTSDGTTLTMYAPSAGCYVQKKLASPDEWKMQGRQVAQALLLQPVVVMMAGLQDLAGIPKRQDGSLTIPTLDSADVVKPEPLDGKPGKRVEGQAQVAAGSGTPTAPMSLWFADDTGLLGEVRYDLTGLYKMMGASQGISVDKAVITVRITGAKVNEPAKEGTFTFTPKATDKAVDALAGAQNAMISRPAPGIEAKDVDGKPVSLAAAKDGLAVVLFWDMMQSPELGSPSLAAITMMQKFKEEFESKGVTFIAVNEDRSGDVPKRLKAFMQKNKIDLRQVIDADRAIGGDYLLMSVPTMVLLRGGVVQAVLPAIKESAEPVVRSDLERLVKGENLFPPPEKKAEGPGATPAATGGAPTPPATPPASAPAGPASTTAPAAPAGK